MGARIQSGVDGWPRNVTPRRAALTFAGNMATRSRIRPQAAHGRVAANKRPAAPASSRTPVANTAMPGRGMVGGTMAIKSLRIGPKCERAVNANIVASAYLAQSCQSLNCDTPKAPRSRQKTSEPNRTTRTAKSGLRDRKEKVFLRLLFYTGDDLRWQQPSKNAARPRTELLHIHAYQSAFFEIND